MLFRGEMPAIDTQQAHEQEDGANQNVEAVETRRHKEVGTIDIAIKGEPGMTIFIDLEHCEKRTQSDGNDQSPLDILAIVFMHQCVVGPCGQTARAQQDQRVD